MKAIKIKLTVVFIVSFLINCSNENDIDYRDIYTGKFDFTIYRTSWSLNPDGNGDNLTTTRHDTSEHSGLIRKYESVDDGDCNYFHDLDDDNENENPQEKITIEFGDCNIITSTLKENGELEYKSGYHYSHQGGFVHIDTIEFSIGGLGGLGGGSSYKIVGIRK